MSDFNIVLARIEAFEDGVQGKQVCAVFQIERGPIGFNIPIYLHGPDFDEAEVVRAAKNSLFRIFAKLATQSKIWELSPDELARLSKMNVRPGGKTIEASTIESRG